MKSVRITAALERLQEDERLRGDLADNAARALITWATARAAALAENSSDDDEQLEAQIRQIRSAAYAAARSGSQEASEVIAHAEALLGPKPAAQPPESALPTPATGLTTALRERIEEQIENMER